VLHYISERTMDLCKPGHIWKNSWLQGRAASLITSAADCEPALIPVGLAVFAAAKFVLVLACPVRLLVRNLRLITVAGFQPELVIFGLSPRHVS